MMFRFGYPVILWALVPVGVWAVFCFQRKPPAINFSSAEKIIRMSGKWSRMWVRMPMVFKCACVILLVTASARPQLYNVSRDVLSAGVDIVLALDVSDSMDTRDFDLDGRSVTRMTVVKKVVSEFIQKRRSDRIGLVVFGDRAFTLSPLTLDTSLLLKFVDRIKKEMAGQNTAIGDGLAVAGKRLKDLNAKSKILILLTDGIHNAGETSPEDSARATAALGIKIYTIGVGIPSSEPSGLGAIFKTTEVRPKGEFDEVLLKKLAQIGEGEFFHAADSEALSEIYHRIDQAEKTEAKIKEFYQVRELYACFLIPALVFLGLEILLNSTLLRVIP